VLDGDFAACWKTIQPSVRRNAYKLGYICPVTCGPDDLYQVAWFGSYQAWPKVKELEHRVQVLTTVAHRRMTDAVRRATGRGTARPLAEGLESADNVEENHGRPEAWLEAKEALANLIARCAGRAHHLKVLNLLVEGYNGCEIAEHLGVTATRVSQICADLRRAVDPAEHRVVVELPVPDPQPQVDWQVEAIREAIHQQMHNIERWE
jgi:DNA-directed RNA polymerase specialized sigma24 family protein